MPNSAPALEWDDLIAKYKHKPVTHGTLGVVVDELYGLLKQQKTTIAALTARIKTLESRPALKWCGIHVDGQPYQEGQLVTKVGGLGLATEPTTFTPGTAGSGWRLIVKRGHA